MVLSRKKKIFKKKSSKHKNFNKLGGECNPPPGPHDLDPITNEELIHINPDERVSVQGDCYYANALCNRIYLRGAYYTPRGKLISPQEYQTLANDYCHNDVDDGYPTTFRIFTTGIADGPNYLDNPNHYVHDWNSILRKYIIDNIPLRFRNIEIHHFDPLSHGWDIKPDWSLDQFEIDLRNILSENDLADTSGRVTVSTFTRDTLHISTDMPFIVIDLAHILYKEKSDDYILTIKGTHIDHIYYNGYAIYTQRPFYCPYLYLEYHSIDRIIRASAETNMPLFIVSKTGRVTTYMDIYYIRNIDSYADWCYPGKAIEDTLLPILKSELKRDLRPNITPEQFNKLAKIIANTELLLKIFKKYETPQINFRRLYNKVFDIAYNFLLTNIKNPIEFFENFKNFENFCIFSTPEI